MLASDLRKIIHRMLNMGLEQRPLVRVTANIQRRRKCFIGVLIGNNQGVLLFRGAEDASGERLFLTELTEIIEIPPLKAAHIINHLLMNAKSTEREAAKASRIITIG